MISSAHLSIIYLLTFFMFACSGGDSRQQDMDASGAQEESSYTMAMNDDIRTINIIGIDDMKFAVEQDYLPPALSDMVLAHTERVGGGETTEVVFTASETPGEYEYLCSFPGHYAAGMKGFLIVSDNESDTATE